MSLSRLASQEVARTVGPVSAAAAATVAFLAWVLSVPGFLIDQNDQILAGFAALVVSTLLGLLDAIVQCGDRA